jgi:hypothetical protein
MKLLQLNQLSKDAAKSVSNSFNRLPHTNHKDGKYRLRRYSVVELRTTFWDAKEEVVVDHLSHRDFNQSEEFNKHQGGMTRSFEEIEDEVLQSEGMKEICFTFKKENNLIDGQEVDIHQMRVITLEGKTFTHVSPEGIHQDGFDHIAMIGIERSNIEGGDLMAYVSKDSDPFLIHQLQPGEMLMLNDRELWHNATPIKRITATAGYGDWFVLCAKA